MTSREARLHYYVLGRVGGKPENVKGGGALCVQMDFTWTSQRNQDATTKLKSNFGSFFNRLANPKLTCHTQAILLMGKL